jgi:hypothetical protein
MDTKVSPWLSSRTLYEEGHWRLGSFVSTTSLTDTCWLVLDTLVFHENLDTSTIRPFRRRKFTLTIVATNVVLQKSSVLFCRVPCRGPISHQRFQTNSRHRFKHHCVGDETCWHLKTSSHGVSTRARVWIILESRPKWFSRTCSAILFYFPIYWIYMQRQSVLHRLSFYNFDTNSCSFSSFEVFARGLERYGWHTRFLWSGNF